MGTNLAQKPKTQNPLFIEEAAAYLEANGYKRSESLEVGSAFYFFNHEIVIEIRGDKVEFAAYHAADDDRNAEYKTFHTFTGIGSLDIFEWILLFHITGAVTIKSFIKGLIKEGTFMSGEEVFRSLMGHFKTNGSQKRIAIAS